MINIFNILKKTFIEGDFKMTKVKDKLTRDQAITEIYSTEEQIENAFIKISWTLGNYPDPWIDSINKNYASFLVYCQGISKKFDEEIKPKL